MSRSLHPFVLTLATVLGGSVLAAALNVPPEQSLPTVVLDNAIVIGKANGTVNQFLGIPFAQPP